MAQMSCSEAIRDGIRMEMRRDPNVFLVGEDVEILDRKSTRLNSSH